MNIFISISLNLILLLVKPGSLNVLSKLIHSSLITSLKIGEFLLFLIFKSKLLVLVIFLMILEFKLESGPLLETLKKFWVDLNICNVTLLKSDSEFGLKCFIEIGHHVLGHV